MFHEVFSTSLGPIKTVCDESNLKKIEFLAIDQNVSLPSSQPLLVEAKRQILEYLEGRRQNFDLPFSFDGGTPFQRKVWQALAQIPFGKWLSYGNLAKEIGSPKAARAVGMAANKNPLPLIIPCHRLLGSKGALVGFAPGLSFKRALLELEGHRTDEKSVS